MRFQSPLLFLAILVTASGCFSPFDGLSGEWSNGELGRTRWQIADGLCPGLGGGCALDVPLAEGAATTLVIDGVDGAALTATASGALVTTEAVVVEEGSDSRVSVEAVSAGTGSIAIFDASGLVDRTSVEVRRATRLECGVWPQSSGGVPWDMEGLDVQTAFSLPFIGPDGSATVEMVCRASDEAGPLLSAGAIRWTVIEGGEVLEVAETGLVIFPAAVAHGARVTYHTPGHGTAVVRAQIGEVTQDLTITIE